MNVIITIILSVIAITIAFLLIDDENFYELRGYLRDASILAYVGSFVCGVMALSPFKFFATLQMILLIIGSLLITTAWILAKGGLERLVYFALNSLGSLFVWLDQFKKREESE